MRKSGFLWAYVFFISEKKGDKLYEYWKSIFGNRTYRKAYETICDSLHDLIAGGRTL